MSQNNGVAWILMILRIENFYQKNGFFKRTYHKIPLIYQNNFCRGTRNAPYVSIISWINKLALKMGFRQTKNSNLSNKK